MIFMRSVLRKKKLAYSSIISSSENPASLGFREVIPMYERSLWKDTYEYDK